MGLPLKRAVGTVGSTGLEASSFPLTSSGAIDHELEFAQSFPGLGQAGLSPQGLKLLTLAIWKSLEIV